MRKKTAKKGGSAKSRAALAKLISYFRRNGYLRLPDKRKTARSKYAYKKGYEVRFVAFDSKELNEIRNALREAGFPVRKAFGKQSQMIQPLYGKEYAEMFMKLGGKKKARKKKTAKRKR